MFYLFITGCVTCCNCGPCRKANGLAPTHQVINLARASGFDNVHDYLVHGRTGETPAQLLERKRTFDWGRWLLCDFVPATPADSETDLRESEDDTSAACDDTDPFDDTPCLTCGGLDRPEDFVLCDGCDQGGHFDCVGKCFFISVFILILVWAIVVTSCFVYRPRRRTRRLLVLRPLRRFIFQGGQGGDDSREGFRERLWIEHDAREAGSGTAEEATPRGAFFPGAVDAVTDKARSRPPPRLAQPAHAPFHRDEEREGRQGDQPEGGPAGYSSRVRRG